MIRCHTLEEHAGGLDVLVNNAGITGGPAQMPTTIDLDVLKPFWTPTCSARFSVLTGELIYPGHLLFDIQTSSWVRSSGSWHNWSRRQMLSAAAPCRESRVDRSGIRLQA